MADPFAHVHDATSEAQGHMGQVLERRTAIPQQRHMPTAAGWLSATASNVLYCVYFTSQRYVVYSPAKYGWSAGSASCW